MTQILIIIVLLLCLVLGFFILVQKPKGGGLSGSFGSLGAQVMGVQKSGDTFEKGTWYTMLAIAVLCIASVYTIPKAVQQQEQTQEQSQEQQSQQGQQGQQQTAPSQGQ